MKQPDTSWCSWPLLEDCSPLSFNWIPAPSIYFFLSVTASIQTNLCICMLYFPIENVCSGTLTMFSLQSLGCSDQSWWCFTSTCMQRTWHQRKNPPELNVLSIYQHVDADYVNVAQLRQSWNQGVSTWETRMWSPQWEDEDTSTHFNRVLQQSKRGSDRVTTFLPRVLLDAHTLQTECSCRMYICKLKY